MGDKKLKTLLEYLDSGQLVLPEIQRDFVWKRQHVHFLFDSLYRGLPIGSMLVWKAKTVVPIKGKRLVKGQAIENFYGYLLDGQQRLTAVQYVRDRDDNYPLLFLLKPSDSSKRDMDRFQYRTGKNKLNPWYVPVADVLSGNFDVLGFIEQLKKRVKGKDQYNFNDVLVDLTKLHGILNYDIGVIEFEEDDYRKATELFIRFNSTGKKLTKSDLTSAELALQVQDLVSRHIRPAATKYGNFKFTMPFLIQCLAGVHTGKMQFQTPYEIWDGSKQSKIKKSWKRTEKGIDRLIEFLTGTVKWNSIQWIPSMNALIPLIYTLSFKRFNSRERKRARKWLLLTSAYASFSGRGWQTLDTYIRKLATSDRSYVDKLWNTTRKSLPEIKPDFFTTRRAVGAAMSLYVSMLRDAGAKDWINRTELSGNVIGYNANLEVHHFFPQSLLRKKGYPTEMINTFANYVILSKDSNLNISDEEPIMYIDRLRIRKKDLDDQCIPEDRNFWKVEKYKKFLAERRKLLARRSNEFLG